MPGEHQRREREKEKERKRERERERMCREAQRIGAAASEPRRRGGWVESEAAEARISTNPRL
jgi:hypothetical protein